MPTKKEQLVEKTDFHDLLYQYDRLKLRISRSKIYNLNLDSYEDELDKIVEYITDIRTNKDSINYQIKKGSKTTVNITNLDDLIEEYYALAEKINNEIENTIKTQKKPFFISLLTPKTIDQINISTLDYLKKELVKIEKDKEEGISDSILEQKSYFLSFLLRKTDYNNESEEKSFKKKALKLINQHRVNLGFSELKNFKKTKEKKKSKPLS